MFVHVSGRGDGARGLTTFIHLASIVHYIWESLMHVALSVSLFLEKKLCLWACPVDYQCRLYCPQFGRGLATLFRYAHWPCQHGTCGVGVALHG